jgi:hypothetical protein
MTRRMTSSETTDETETETHVTTEQVNETTTQAGGDGMDELVEDPQDCEHCVAEGGLCVWHAGFQAGWDLCAQFVAHHSHGDVELEAAGAGGEGVG